MNLVHTVVMFAFCAITQASRHGPLSVIAAPASAQANNSVSGKKQFDKQRNTSSLCTGIRAQAFGTISASELASLQGKKL